MTKMSHRDNSRMLKSENIVKELLLKAVGLKSIYADIC
jgi:hypothetical protein